MVAAIKDYSSVQFIIDNTADSIKTEREMMSGLTSHVWDGMPHGHDPGAGEDRCYKQKAVKLVHELDQERDIGLIEKKRIGFGKVNIYYVKN